MSPCPGCPGCPGLLASVYLFENTQFYFGNNYYFIPDILDIPDKHNNTRENKAFAVSGIVSGMGYGLAGTRHPGEGHFLGSKAS